VPRTQNTQPSLGAERHATVPCAKHRANAESKWLLASLLNDWSKQGVFFFLTGKRTWSDVKELTPEDKKRKQRKISCERHQQDSITRFMKC